jgi:trehalose/maltose transport system permease protein
VARRPQPLQRARVRTALWLLAPALALLLAVAAWPLLHTVALAFSDATLERPGAARWVGGENFAALAADPDWWQALANTLRFAALSVSLELALGLGVALVLRRAFPGNGLVRAAVLLPWAVPNVVSARLWAWMAHDLYGVFNDLLLRAGLIAHPVAWLADPAGALGLIVAADVWKTTPFVALLLLAGLQAIPRELYESARVDGAGPWRAFRHVTLPLLRPALAVALTLRLLDALRVFDVVYVLTGSSRATATVSVYARQQLIDFQDFGFGSAAACAIFLLVALATVTALTALRVRLEAP